MEEWVTLFKSNPLVAIGTVVFGGVAWFLKSRQETSVDNKEVTRLTTALEVVIKERDDANDRADAAFAKQLELTERFSEMRAQNAQVMARMEQLSEQMHNVLEENGQLRMQVTNLSDELHKLRSALQTGTSL